MPSGKHGSRLDNKTGMTQSGNILNDVPAFSQHIDKLGVVKQLKRFPTTFRI